MTTENLSAESKIVFGAAQRRLASGEMPHDDDLVSDTVLDPVIVREVLVFLGANHLNIKPVGDRIQVLGVDASWTS